jgi:hypothetical protein
LILSRDQTLIGFNELSSLRFTQSTDEFFFTASNQIVNDLRSPTQAYSIPGLMAGLETCSRLRPIHTGHACKTGKSENFLKEPNRKAVFRPDQWPERSFVTIPYRGSLYLYHVRRAGANAPERHAMPQKILKSATQLE